MPIASTEESHNSPKKVRWDNSVSSGDEDTGEPTETQAEPREKVSQASRFVGHTNTHIDMLGDIMSIVRLSKG